MTGAVKTFSDQILEFTQNVPVQLALEGDDQVRQAFRRHPSPFPEFGMVGFDIDIFVGAEEAREEPDLALAAKLPAPQLSDQFSWQVVEMLVPCLGDNLYMGMDDARFLPQFAERGGLHIFAVIDAALWHLP